MAKRKQKSPYKKVMQTGKPIIAEPKGLGRDINLPVEMRIPASHPSDIKESFIEQMIKKAARERGTYMREDEPYLEQYLHPERDILERQTDRPTLGGPASDMPYRKLHRFPETPTQDESYNLEGLGEFKFDESNPNYNSIYDVWDFDTKTALSANKNEALRKRQILPSLADIEDLIAKQVMQRVGKPYTVYERIPKGAIRKQIIGKK